MRLNRNGAVWLNASDSHQTSVEVMLLYRMHKMANTQRCGGKFGVPTGRGGLQVPQHTFSGQRPLRQLVELSQRAEARRKSDPREKVTS